MKGNFHVRCGVGEKLEIIMWNNMLKAYLSLFIPKYVQGKNYKNNISYECLQLQPILSPTYGCIVYQGVLR